MTVHGLDLARVFAVRSSGGEFGSAYLVSEAYLLTAAHVVPEDSCEVRPIAGTWIAASVKHRDLALDVALLETASTKVSPAIWGLADWGEEWPCEIGGFPRSERQEQSDRVRRHSGAEPGLIKRAYGQEDRKLHIELQALPPKRDTEQQLRWLGLSGSPVFSRGLMIGVIIEEHAEFSGSRLIATPMEEILARFPGGLLDWERPWSIASGLHQRSVQSLASCSTGLSNLLGEYIGRSRPVAFGGRRSEIDALDAWLEDDTRPPYRLLTGGAGRGKTALLVQWLAARLGKLDRNVAFHSISARFETNTEEAVFGSLAAQLARLEGVEVKSESLASARSAVDEALSRARSGAKRLLLIVDGLDEASGWRPGAGFFPADPPEGLRILASARSEGEDRGALRRQLGWTDPSLAEVEVLDALDFEAISEVVRSLLGEVDAELIDRIWMLSEGDPLVVRAYVDWCADERSEGRNAIASRLPSDPGLGPFFEHWWRAQRSLWGSSAPLREMTAKRVFQTLAIARGPLLATELTGLLADMEIDTTDLTEAIEALTRRLVVGDGGEHGFVLCHPRYREYLRKTHFNAEELRRWDQRFAGFFTSEVRHAVKDEAPDRIPSYALRHLCRHLLELEASTEDLALISSSVWAAARERQDASLASFIDDLETIVDAGVELWLVIRIHLFASSASGASNLGSPDLLAKLVEYEVWSVRRALAFVGLMLLHSRTDALISLAPWIQSAKEREVARTIASHFSADDRERVEHALLGRPIQSREDTPLIWSHVPAWSSVHVAALKSTNGKAHAESWSRARDILLTKSPEMRLMGWAQLFPHVREELVAEVEERITTDFQCGEFTDRHAVRVASAMLIAGDRLRSPRLREAMEASLTSSYLMQAWLSAYNRLQGNAKRFAARRAIAAADGELEAAYALAQTLDGIEDAEEAAAEVDRVCQLDIEPTARFAVLAAWARHAACPDPDPIIFELLASGDPEVSRTAPLERLSADGSADLARQVIGWGPEYARDSYLLPLLPKLDPTLRQEALTACLETRGRIGDRSRAAAFLAAVACFDERHAPTAFEWARSVSHPVDRVSALLRVAERLPSALVGSYPFSTAGLEALARYDEADRHNGKYSRDLVELAEFMPSDAAERALEDAWLIDHPWRRCIAVAALARRLEALRRNTVVESALRDAVDLPEEEGRSTALAELGSAAVDVLQREIIAMILSGSADLAGSLPLMLTYAPNEMLAEVAARARALAGGDLRTDMKCDLLLATLDRAPTDSSIVDQIVEASRFHTEPTAVLSALHHRSEGEVRSRVWKDLVSRLAVGLSSFHSVSTWLLCTFSKATDDELRDLTALLPTALEIAAKEGRPRLLELLTEVVPFLERIAGRRSLDRVVEAVVESQRIWP